MPAVPAFLRAPLLSAAVERIDDVVGADHARLRALLGGALRRPRPA